MCLRLEAAYRTLAAESEEKLRLERDLHESEKLATLGSCLAWPMKSAPPRTSSRAGLSSSYGGTLPKKIGPF